jgi:hypothetical protein
MDTPQQPARNTEANIRKAAEAIAEVLEMKPEFIRCHDLLANKTYRLVELLGQAESRGYLLEDSLTVVDTAHWLQHIDWQTKFLSMVLNFTKNPSRKTLRPLIELYGRDRDRMKVEAEILERQLKHRLATFAQPDDATVRKAIMKNEQRVLAVYLHVRSGYRGIDVARFFKVPRTTAYGWISWFESLPEGLQAGILAFMDTQAPIMAACQVPAAVPKTEGGSQSGGSSARQPSPHGADAGSGSGPSGSGVPVVKSA